MYPTLTSSEKLANNNIPPGFNIPKQWRVS